jgi:hypothetical protein
MTDMGYFVCSSSGIPIGSHVGLRVGQWNAEGMPGENEHSPGCFLAPHTPSFLSITNLTP